MLSDKNKKWNKTGNTVPFILTKILGYKAENAYDVESIQTKILKRMTAYADKENGSGDRRYRGRKGGRGKEYSSHSEDKSTDAFSRTLVM